VRGYERTQASSLAIQLAPYQPVKTANPDAYDLEDTFTEGATPDEAPFNGAEALSAMLGWMLDENRPIPGPSPAGDGAYFVAPDAWTQAALLIGRAR
jgi:predicted RNase H-like HicB family nuclease